MDIPQIIKTLSDPTKDYTGRTKAERTRDLIEAIKAKNLGDKIFLGVGMYLPLYRYKGCNAFKTVEEILGVIEESNLGGKRGSKGSSDKI